MKRSSSGKTTRSPAAAKMTPKGTVAAPKRAATGRRASTARTPPKTTTRARRTEAAPALTPIRHRQNRDQIINTVALDSGIETRTVERVARSLSQTLTRHLIDGGSGRVEIPYLGAALLRGRQGARPARTMSSPLMLGGRTIKIPAQAARPAPKLRAHRVFREIVARG